MVVRCGLNLLSNYVYLENKNITPLGGINQSMGQLYKVLNHTTNERSA
jgi:hypothetical protein